MHCLFAFLVCLLGFVFVFVFYSSMPISMPLKNVLDSLPLKLLSGYWRSSAKYLSSRLVSTVGLSFKLILRGNGSLRIRSGRSWPLGEAFLSVYLAFVMTKPF